MVLVSIEHGAEYGKTVCPNHDPGRSTCVVHGRLAIIYDRLSYFVYYRWKELIVTCDYKVLSSQVFATPLKLQDNMEAPTPKRRKNKIMTDECLIKLRQRYDEDRLDIPSFLKVAGPRCFQRPPKI
ncbi:unnamed protein product [Rotaria magnacalcarata]